MFRFLAALTGLLAIGCSPSESGPRAYRIEHPSERIGGPYALAYPGDFVVQNDHVRFGILEAGDSPGPGLFGGSIVDADLVRHEAEFRGGGGLDHFGEIFPIANLFIYNPDGTDDATVAITEDGSADFCPIPPISGENGPCAIVHAAGPADSLLTAITAVQFLVDPIRKMSTDFIVREGTRHLEMITHFERASVNESGEPLELPSFTEASPLFETLLGDRVLGKEPAVFAPGLIGGDFTTFGTSVDIFTPGAGFDHRSELLDRTLAGDDVFGRPATFDYIAGVGDRVSYVMGTADGILSVPFFTSAITVTLSHGLRCLEDPSDDAECSDRRFVNFRRFLTVGEGDVDTALRELWRLRGTETGEVHGTVYDGGTASPITGADVYALLDPLEGVDAADRPGACDRLAEAPTSIDYNRLEACAVAISGVEPEIGIVNHAKTDVGANPTIEGRFSMALPPGNYYLVARSDPHLPSPAVRVSVRAGRERSLSLPVEPAGRVAFHVRNEAGLTFGAKLTFVGLECDPEVNPLRCDRIMRRYGRRYAQMGEGRNLDDITLIYHSVSGHDEIGVPPGRYRLLISHGPEYTIDERIIDVPIGRTAEPVEAVLQRVVDTSGWIAADLHIHAMPSHDSGVPFDIRAISSYVEGVELMSSADHDVLTDYDPWVRDLGLSREMATQVGLETTTIEYGHFLGFPLRYDETHQTRGAFEWFGLSPEEIFDSLRSSGSFAPADTIVVVAHPRDGFFGYFDQYGLDPFDLTLSPNALFAALNDIYARDNFVHSYDAMEIMTGKNLQYLRTPTTAEAQDFSVALGDLRANRGILVTQRRKAELELATAVAADLLIRTAAESTALGFGGQQARCPRGAGCACTTHSDCAVGEQCSAGGCIEGDCGSMLAASPGGGILPCNGVEGVMEDWFRLILDAGIFRPILGNSDTHDLTGTEAGMPRTYVCSGTDDPSGIDHFEIAANIRAGCAIATNGPFVELFVDGQPIGSTVSTGKHQSVAVRVRVQGADWYDVTRVEVLRNGQLIRDFSIDVPNEGVLKLDRTFPDTPGQDAFYVALALGEGGAPAGNSTSGRARSLSPVYSSVTEPNVSIAQVLEFGLAGRTVAGLDIGSFVSGAPETPQIVNVLPFGVTNPVFVDTDGDGEFTSAVVGPVFTPALNRKDDHKALRADIARRFRRIAHRLAMAR